MAGLDNIKKFEDGGEVPATDYSTSPTAQPAVMTPATAKNSMLPGKYTSKTAVGEDILAKMEKLIAEREAQRGSFLESMKDATAWWSGGVNGPGEALARRAAEREAQQTGTFGMQRDLAQYRAAQKRAQALQQANAGLFGGAGGAGSGGAGGAGGGMSGAYSFLSPAAQMEFQRLNAEDPDAANEYLRKMVAKNQEIESSFLANPAAYNQAKRWNEQTNQYEMVDPVAIRARQRAMVQANRPVAPTAPVVDGAGAGAPAPSAAPAAPTAGAPITNLGNIRPQGQSTGFQQFGTREEGLAAIDKNLQAYGNKGINTLEGVISRWSPPNENDTAGLIAAASKRLGIKPNQPIDLSDPVTRQAIGTAIMLQEHGPKIFAASKGAPAAAAAPTATPTAAPKAPPTGVTQPTGTAGLPAFQQADIAAGTEKIAREEEAKGPAKAAGERAAALEKAAAKSTAAVSQAERLLNLSKNNPKIFNLEAGDLIGSGGVYTAAKLAHLGNKDEASKFTAERYLKGQDLADWNIMHGGAKELGIGFAGEVFQGAKQMGIGMELLAQAAKGVGPDLPAKTNQLNLEKIIAVGKANEAMGKMWDDYKKQHGSTAKFTDFENLDYVKQYKKDAEADLNKKFPGVYKEKSSTGNIESMAKTQFGGYDADKYEYRINPDTGKLQRKAK